MAMFMGKYVCFIVLQKRTNHFDQINHHFVEIKNSLISWSTHVATIVVKLLNELEMAKIYYFFYLHMYFD
jgi:hypothetical protein